MALSVEIRHTKECGDNLWPTSATRLSDNGAINKAASNSAPASSLDVRAEFTKHCSTMSCQDGARNRRCLATNSDTHDNMTTQVQNDVSNNGAGAQHNKFGTGNQNNNSGFGTQYNANSIYIGTNPFAYVTPVSTPAALLLHIFLSLYMSLRAFARLSPSLMTCSTHSVIH